MLDSGVCAMGEVGLAGCFFLTFQRLRGSCVWRAFAGVWGAGQMGAEVFRWGLRRFGVVGRGGWL